MQAFFISDLVAVAAGAPAGPFVAGPGHAAPDLAEPQVYTYQYGVNDDYSGANFQQTESRDGYASSGSYTGALPDGRMQTVKYADNEDGIVQDVTCERVPQYGPAFFKTAFVAHCFLITIKQIFMKKRRRWYGGQDEFLPSCGIWSCRLQG